MRTHLVYFHPDKYNGYGCCYEDRVKKRMYEQKLDVSKIKIVHIGLTIKEASERERELQLRDGYPLDKVTYEYWMSKVIPTSHTKASRKKAVANTDYSKRVVPNYRPNTKFRHRVKAIRVIDNSVIGIYNSQLEAAKQLGVHQATINLIVRGITKQTKGYTFEYADR